MCTLKHRLCVSSDFQYHFQLNLSFFRETLLLNLTWRFFSGKLSSNLAATPLMKGGKLLPPSSLILFILHSTIRFTKRFICMPGTLSARDYEILRDETPGMLTEDAAKQQTWCFFQINYNNRQANL